MDTNHEYEILKNKSRIEEIKRDIEIYEHKLKELQEDANNMKEQIGECRFTEVAFAHYARENGISYTSE